MVDIYFKFGIYIGLYVRAILTLKRDKYRQIFQ